MRGSAEERLIDESRGPETSVVFFALPQYSRSSPIWGQCFLIISTLIYIGRSSHNVLTGFSTCGRLLVNCKLLSFFRPLQGPLF
jgi:hypothetical protein